MKKSILVAVVLTLVLFLSTGSIYGAQSPVVDRDVIYCDCSGLGLTMDLYYPESSKSSTPAVVYIHGGGWYSGDKTDAPGQSIIPELLDRGFLVAAVNYRLAPRYPFPAQIEDIQCAIRFLRANAVTYGIDPTRIGVFGDSAGGHLAALLGLASDNCQFGMPQNYTDQLTDVQAVVDLFGPSDLVSFFESNQSLLFLEHVFNTDDPQSEILKEASPITYVSQDAPPFLLIHGEKDDVVLLSQSEELYNRLVAANVPADLVVVKNCGHEFVPVDGSISPDTSQIAQTIGSFFDLYLK